MITLQRSFEYAEGASPPTSNANINISFPQFSFKETLSVAGQASVNFDQPLASKQYQVDIPTIEIFGTNYGLTAASYLTSLRDKSDPLKLKDLGVTFTASYGGDTFSKLDLEALWFLKLLTPNGAEGEEVSREQDIPREERLLNHAVVTRDYNQIVDKNVYVINKKVYMEVLHSMFDDIEEKEEAILLYLVNAVLDLKGDAPAFTTEVNMKALEAVLRHYERNVERAPSIRQTLADNFAKLFDFPLKMGEIKLLKIAGIIRINDDNVRFDDFTLCTLSSELAIAGSPHVLRYDWDEKDFDDGRVKFALPEDYVQNSITGMVAVKVMSFDNTRLYYHEFKPSDPTLQNLVIVITPKRPSVIRPPPVRISKPTKLRGQVVSLDPHPETLQGVVVIQAKKTTEGEWFTIASANSDRIGNFSMPYPSGEFVSAQALVSLDADSITPIGVNESAIAVDFIYILLQTSDKKPEKKDDCKCEEAPTTGRLPTQEDLIQSDQFSQDIGGSCLNLNTPNRSLQEFNYQAIVRTSDPDVANYSVRAVTDDDGSRRFLMANHGKIDRPLVDLDHPIKWQDDEDDTIVETKSSYPFGRIDRKAYLDYTLLPRKKPDLSISLYQAVTVATGHILHYKSEFRADGYSLGDLLYSVPLAPGQKKQIVVFDASHSFSGSEEQNVSQAESLASNLLNERSIVDQIAGNIGEMTRGQSEASTWGVSGAAGASGSSGFIGASAGVAGGYSNASSNAAQDSNRNLSQYFGEMLRQRIDQNASSYRKLTASAVTTVKEGQQYNAETTVISNHNHCHSLTMMYFEVLRHFAVFQSLVDVEECVFVPLLMTKFTNLNVSKWADVLVTKLLPLHSNTYLTPYTHPNSAFQHPLVPAFDALERIRTKYSMVDYPKGSYDSEPMRQVEGSLVIQVDLPRPQTRYDNILSLPIITKTVSHEEIDGKDFIKSVALGAINPFSWFDGPQTHTVTQQILAKKEIFDQFMSMDATYESVPPAQCIRVNSFVTISFSGLFSGSINPLRFVSMTPIDRRMWKVYAYCHDYGDSDVGVAKLMDIYFKGQLLSDWDGIFQSQIVPKVYDRLANAINFKQISVDMSVDGKYNGGERYMTVNFNAPVAGKSRTDIGRLDLWCSNSTLKKLQTHVVFTLRTARVAYSTNHFRGLLFNGTPNGDILDSGCFMDCPETWDEKRDPRKEDVFIVNRLIDHLNFNLEYYNRCLWYNLDPDRRWLLLDGFKIQIYDKNGRPEKPESYRSLASVLKNQLIAVTGNSLVFPVAPGFRVNRSLVVADSDGEFQPEESLLNHYKPVIPPPPYRLSVPTRGVYMESVLGQCDSCEKLKPDSSQDWTKFTTDEPTSIAQVTPPVPTVTDYKAAFEKLANPLISMQNAPAAPDPGAGLAASTDLLGKTGLFKDITGLEANQANAIRTYLSNNDNVRAIASMANGLAIQSANMENSARFMDTASAAHDKGVLSDEEYGKLVKQHLQQQIDGGATLKADLESQKSAEKPSLEDAAVQAVAAGKEVKAVTTDADGNTHSIDVKGPTLAFAGTGSMLGAIRHDVKAAGTGTFAVGKSQDAITEFTSHFTGNPSTVTSGQFQITNLVNIQIREILKKEFDQNNNNELRAKLKKKDFYLWDHKSSSEIQTWIKSRHQEDLYPQTMALFEDYKGPGVKKIYYDFWWPESITPSPSIEKPTFMFLEHSYLYEGNKCGFTSALLARKYVQLRVGQAKPKLPDSISFDTIIDCRIEPTKVTKGDTQTKQSLIYDKKDALQKAVDSTIKSLTYETPGADKQTATPLHRPVVAGVLSGRNHADNGVPFSLVKPVTPEHFILIIGFDEASGSFVFWDSDTPSSYIKSQGWAQGWGVLFAQNNRFGTAFDDQDFDQVNEAGYHMKGTDDRHRYQVYYTRNSYLVDAVKDLEYLGDDSRKAVTYKYGEPPTKKNH